MGVSRDFPNFFEYPLLSQERVKLRTSNLAVYSEVPCEHKRIKSLEKRECGRIQGRPNFFGIPPIISGTRKAMIFKFGRYIQRVHPNKSRLKICEKRERGISRDFPNFSSTPRHYLRKA